MISESEWLTRKRRIDGRLKALGRKIVKFSERLTLDSLNKVAVEELPTANGSGRIASDARIRSDVRHPCEYVSGQLKPATKGRN